MAKYTFKPIFSHALNEAVKSLENAKDNMDTNLARIEGIKVQPSKVLYACRGFDITAEVELNGRQFSCIHIYELNEGGDFALEKSGVSYQDEGGEWQTEYTQSGTIIEMMKVLRRLAGITD